MICEFELDLWCNISKIQAVKLNLLCTDDQECKPLCYVIFLSRHQVSSPWPSRPPVQTRTEGAFSVRFEQPQLICSIPVAPGLWPCFAVLAVQSEFGLRKPVQYKLTHTVHDDGVYKSIRRTFSYAPRKMKPPMLMNVTLGMLPANSLQTGWENIQARVSNNSLFKLVINYKTSTFVETSHSIKRIPRLLYSQYFTIFFLIYIFIYHLSTDSGSLHTGLFFKL